jgi:hypothetical protein
MKIVLAYSYLGIIIIALVSLIVYGLIFNEHARIGILGGLISFVFWMSLMWSIFTIIDHRTKKAKQ